MNTLAEAIINQSTTTLTENGAVTYSTSLDPIVDMFFHLAAKRGFAYSEIVKVIDPAFRADPELAFRVALWARDVREGAGERQIYRYILRYLAERNQFDLVIRAIDATIDLGRTDDLFELLKFDAQREVTLDKINTELKAGNGLVAKWIPRKGPINAMIRNYMGFSAREFRKLLVSLTNVVETKMCAKEWGEINYSHVPSVAGTRYRKAFLRNDGVRYGEYINRVKTGGINPETGKVEKINTGALYPYDVIKGIATSCVYGRGYAGGSDAESLDVLWNNLPDFVPQGLSFIPVIDTSGSMTSPVGTSGVSCLDVAVSLGIYLAERNKGAFKNLWLNFSTNPNWNVVKGANIVQKIENLDYRNWSGSTNLEVAMRLIAKTARKNNVPAEDMPQFLLVLSDMEFNIWGQKAPGEQIRDLFEHYGYKAPNIVWWNIQSRNGSTPVRANDSGMALVSGLSPSIVKNLLSGEVTPYSIMMKTIMRDRYDY